MNPKHGLPPRAIDGLAQPQKFFSCAAVLLSIMVMVTDTSMVASALPFVAEQLNASDRTVVWLVTVYQLTVVVTVLPFSALGESWGYRRLFRCGLLFFIVGATCCAVSTSFPVLMAGRILQGFGASAIYATMATILIFSVPTNRMGRAIGNNSLVVGISSAAGPSLGMMVTSHFNWQALFLCSIPMAVLAGLCSLALPVMPAGKNRLRIVPVVLTVTALSCFLFAIDTFPAAPVKALPFLIFAIVIGATLIRIDVKTENHFLPIDILRNPIASLAAAASLFMFMSQMVSSMAIPFYLMRRLGLGLGEMGALLALWPIAVATMAVLSGWLSDRHSTAILAAIGSGLLAVSLFAIAFWPNPTVFLLSCLCFTCGMGFGLFQSPNNRAMILSAPKTRTAGAGAVQALARQLGYSIGAAATGGVFNLLPGSDGGWALVMAACAAALGFALSVGRATCQTIKTL